MIQLFFKSILIAGTFASLLFISGCQEEKVDVAKLTPEQKLAHEKKERVKLGKALYMSECIACHNANPRMAGGIGPDVYGSSMELLTYRLKKLEYPPGYTPKRPKSEQMPEFDHLTDEQVKQLHAFLNTP